MKFTAFHLMSYPYLPPDFIKKYRSVWVDIPRSLYDPKLGHHIYNDYLDQLEFADRLGFDGIGVNEHHQNAYGLMPSPNIMAAALARRTRHANLVVLGNSIALYNPPVRVAEDRRVPGRHSDGYELLLWRGAGHATREISRGT
jgi:hypothetical protein